MEELRKISFEKIIEITPFDDVVVKRFYIPEIMKFVDGDIKIINGRITESHDVSKIPPTSGFMY